MDMDQYNFNRKVRTMIRLRKERLKPDIQWHWKMKDRNDEKRDVPPDPDGHVQYYFAYYLRKRRSYRHRIDKGTFNVLS